MLFPLSLLDADEPQVLFDGTPANLDDAKDERVRQFVRGEAGQRLLQLAEEA